MNSSIKIGQYGHAIFLVIICFSGIGLGLIDEVAQCLQQSYNLHFCVTCRNMKKGEELKSNLKKYPVAVTLVKMNVESVKSVLQACEEIKQKFDSIDYMFLNAGIMPTHGVEWQYLFKTVFSTKVIEMFRTGNGLFRTKQHINDEGVNNIFATNVLGHFVLIRQLTSLLRRKHVDEDTEASRIIWTSSTSASRDNFDRNDITGSNGSNAYSSSKYVLEEISIELNKKYNSEGISSYVCDPGTVITNLTGSLMPVWLWYASLPILWMVRLLIPSLTITPQNACYAFVWLIKQPSRNLNSHIRYGSCTTFLNQKYVTEILMDDVDSAYIFSEISSLSEKLTEEFS